MYVILSISVTSPARRYHYLIHKTAHSALTVRLPKLPPLSYAVLCNTGKRVLAGGCGGAVGGLGSGSWVLLRHRHVQTPKKQVAGHHCRENNPREVC
ncbi:hypothetical protein E2C01_090127 [Portunus trituberculatus]|uniref:Uncharacterized protein n=1 Tax=Portunus trituberculatus TaxID=210409 RepID=A0A5B7JK30_PORTR|nr:hypothetical protein [Portunus trituberculatus]